MNHNGMLKFSNSSLFITLITFNVLNFFDKFTTYFGMQRGFIEFNDRAFYFISELGILQSQLLLLFAGMVCSIAIYFALVKSLKFLAVHIPILLGYIYVSINYLLAVIGNVYYLVAG